MSFFKIIANKSSRAGKTKEISVSKQVAKKKKMPFQRITTQAFEIISHHEPATAAAFVASTRPLMNSSIIPEVLSNKDLCISLYQRDTMSMMSGFRPWTKFFLLSDTMQFSSLMMMMMMTISSML